MSGSSVKGAASYRRFLKRLPDSAHNKFLDLLTRAGPVLAAGMRDRLPTLTGKLNSGITSKVTPATLSLKVGLLTKAVQKADFYGHILDVGRRAQVVQAIHRHTTGNTYAMNIPALAGLHVEYQGLQDFKRDFLPNYRALTDRILTDAAQGAGDD